LYEVDGGRWKVNYKPKENVPVIEWFKLQGRFKHLLSHDPEGVLATHQADVDRNWAALLEKEQRGSEET
jgi:pyruvate ferredoxin oxidoreductase beta subunit